MITLKSLYLTLGMMSALIVNAQTSFDVPQNVELKSKDDYAKYEDVIIGASKWLEATDLDKETGKRLEVNTFVIQWITGSPTVTIEVNEQLGKAYGKNAQLLAIYLASYARNFLEQKNIATKFSATKAGLISMINVYKNGIEISKSKEMEKLIKLDESKLDGYIKDKLL